MENSTFCTTVITLLYNSPEPLPKPRPSVTMNPSPVTAGLPYRGKATENRYSRKPASRRTGDKKYAAGGRNAHPRPRSAAAIERKVLGTLNKTEQTSIIHAAPQKGGRPTEPAARPHTKQPPWNEWLRLARQGDEDAKLRFCAQAEPFIKTLCRIPYFTARMSREEARSIATLTLVEFLMTYPSPPEDKEIPALLKGVARNALLNRVKRIRSRNRFEQRMTTLREADDADTEEDAIENIPAPGKDEPENRALQNELRGLTAAALRQLLPGEQAVIRAFFFQEKTAAAIAKELRCSRQYAEKVRDTALRKLRRLLEGCHIFNDGAFSC